MRRNLRVCKFISYLFETNFFYFSLFYKIHFKYMTLRESRILIYWFFFFIYLHFVRYKRRIISFLHIYLFNELLTYQTTYSTITKHILFNISIQIIPQLSIILNKLISFNSISKIKIYRFLSAKIVASSVARFSIKVWQCDNSKIHPVFLSFFSSSS